MVHDDWRGTLQINPSDQLRYARDGSCTYRYYAIDGWYTRGDGVRLNFNTGFLELIDLIGGFVFSRPAWHYACGV